MPSHTFKTNISCPVPGHWEGADGDHASPIHPALAQSVTGRDTLTGKQWVCLPTAKYRTDLLCRIRWDKDALKAKGPMPVTGGRDAIQDGRQSTHNSILDRPGSPRKGHRAPRVCVSLDREDMESGLMWGTDLRQSGDIIPAESRYNP